jgi:hypothetical protein
MQFTITNVTMCSGGNHILITATVGGVTRTIQTDLEELKGIQENSDSNLRLAGLARVISAIKESGATTNAQRRTALLNKTFEV